MVGERRVGLRAGSGRLILECSLLLRVRASSSPNFMSIEKGHEQSWLFVAALVTWRYLPLLHADRSFRWRACESAAASWRARREGLAFSEASKNDGDSAINLNLEEPIHLSLCGRPSGREPRRNSRAFCSQRN